MKKALLACAVSMALLNVVGCSDQNTQTPNQDALAQAQNASAQFAVNFPEPEVQASLISADAQGIKLRMVSVSALLSALEICKEQGGWPDYCLGETNEVSEEAKAARDYYNLFPESEYLQTIFSKYTSLSAEDLKEGHTIHFSSEMAETFKPLIDAGALDKLDLGSALIERDLTREANSASISNLLTGLYLIVAEQQDAQDERIAYEMMTANLGEGENPITLNMMSGSWQVVNSSNQAAPLSFNLLSSSLSAEWDWDQNSEGNQNVIEAASGGDTSSAALAAIHYWNHGQPYSSSQVIPTLDEDSILDPVDFIFDLRLDDDSIDSIRAYNDFDNDDYAQAQSEQEVPSKMEGFFHQMYDARLSDSKTIQGGMFNFEVDLHLGNYNMSQSLDQEAGVTILDEGIPSLVTNNDGSGNRIYEDNEYGYQDDYYNEYQNSRTYTDGAGQSQTLYFVSKYNSDMIWKSPTTDANLSTLTNMTVTGGNQINGYLVEYISRGTSFNVEGTSSTILDENKPQTNAQIALAMGQLQKTIGLTASAAAHPLGSQCAAIDETFIDYNATYAWIDDKWQAGTHNWSYQVSQGESGWVVSGNDLNGNGLIEVFEVGVVDNWGREEEYCQNCEEIPLYNRVISREEGDEILYGFNAYAYISDAELEQDWTEVLNESQTPVPFQYEKDGVKITISSQQFHVTDLDDDGLVEYYENVGGKTVTELYDIHVCYQPIILRGGAQEKALDDFLYEPQDPSIEVEVTVTTTAYTQGELRVSDNATMQCDMDENRQVDDVEIFTEVWTRSDDIITVYDDGDQWTMPINLSTATIDLNGTYVEEDPTGTYGDIYTYTEDSTGSLVWNAATSVFEGSIREINTLSWTINDETSVCDETMSVSVSVTSGSIEKFLGTE